MNDSPEKKLIASGKYMNVVVRRGWEYVERTNVSAIVALIAVTDDGRILLTEQYREPVGNRVVELPAGLVGDVPGRESEDLRAASQRELMEETGYRAERFEELIVGPPSAGITSEIVTFFRATGLRKVGAGGGDDSERITVHEVPLARADQWLRERAKQGVLVDPKVYTGLYFAGER
jgi:ADP-ribose pyrophosphatase